MAGIGDAAGQRIMVPTGDWSGGAIEVECIASYCGASHDGFVRDVGTSAFAGQLQTLPSHRPHRRKMVPFSCNRQGRRACARNA